MEFVVGKSLFLACCLLCAHSTLLALPTKFFGIAYDKEGKLLFKEEHTVVEKDGKVESVTTNFFSPFGRKIAYFESKFLASIYLPNVFYYRIADNFTSQALRVSEDQIALLEKEKGWSQFLKKTFTINSDMVVGHGFYFFLIDQMENIITKTKEIPFEYLLPNFLEKISFNLSGHLDPNDSNIAVLRLKPKKPIYRLFTTDVEVKIDRENNWLVSYTGPNTFVDAKRGLPYIKIEYHQ